MTIPAAQLKLYATFAALVMVILMVILVVVTLLTGHDLSDNRITQLLGFGITITVALFGFAGLGGAVQDVHLAVNSRLDQLVATTASDAYQQGQAAGPMSAPSGAAGPNMPPPASSAGSAP